MMFVTITTPTQSTQPIQNKTKEKQPKTVFTVRQSAPLPIKRVERKQKFIEKPNRDIVYTHLFNQIQQAISTHQAPRCVQLISLYIFFFYSLYCEGHYFILSLSFSLSLSVYVFYNCFLFCRFSVSKIEKRKSIFLST